MLIIGTPKDLDKYIEARGNLNEKLQQAGFHPLYKNGWSFYYCKNDKLMEFISSQNL